MENAERKNVYKVYDKIASWFSENRYNKLIEKNYLDNLIEHIPAEGYVLDLGGGTGKFCWSGFATPFDTIKLYFFGCGF